MTHNCLNCNEPIEGNYCKNCGQKTSTHRFSLQHFFGHDFIHGVFHFDKGFLFTIKELFTRPGHSIREYIQGKRVRHFNYFTAVIFILALDYSFTKIFHIDSAKLFTTSSGLFRVLKDYGKIVPFLGIPFFALLSYFFFRKSKQNYTEHLVLNIYMISGWLLLNFTLKVCMVFTDDLEAFRQVNNIYIYLTFAYVYIFFYQYFSVFGYKKIMLLIKVLVVALLILVVKQTINSLLNEIGMRYFS